MLLNVLERVLLKGIFCFSFLTRTMTAGGTYISDGRHWRSRGRCKVTRLYHLNCNGSLRSNEFEMFQKEVAKKGLEEERSPLVLENGAIGSLKEIAEMEQLEAYAKLKKKVVLNFDLNEYGDCGFDLNKFPEERGVYEGVEFPEMLRTLLKIYLQKFFY